METITIPALYCPFPVRVNPHREELQNYFLWFVQHFRLIQNERALQRFVASRFDWFIALIHPVGSFDSLALAGSWHIAFFVFDDCCWEDQIHIRQRQIPDIATYVEKRRLTGGNWLVFDLIEVVLRIDLPPQVFECPQVRKLRQMTADIAC